MIAVGCDHAGVSLKQAVLSLLSDRGLSYVDYGTQEGTPVDYPLIATAVSEAVSSGTCEKGILVCGTGIGMSMSANKYHGIRAAVCCDTFSARMTRLHNDANVLCLGERVVGVGLAMDIVAHFLDTEFEGGRHQRRVDQIMLIED